MIDSFKKAFRKIDETFFPIFNDKIKNSFFDWLLPKYTYLGGLVFIISLTAIMVLFGKGNIRYIGMQMAFSLIISQGITYSLKSLIARERPYNVLDNLHTFGFVMKDYCFPSGHSSASFTVAVIIALNVPSLAILVLLMAALVAMSRMYVGVHYPTDVIAGIIIGVGSSLIVYNFLLKYVVKVINIIF